MHPQRALVLGVALGATVHAVHAQMRLDSIMHYALLPIHGIPTWSPAIREHVTSDHHALDVYASLLDGTWTTTTRWHRDVALYWLAESGEPKYVPILLRFTTPSVTVPPIIAQITVSLAAYGLARDAIDSGAAHQLHAMIGTDSIQRRIAIHALAVVNDTITRAMLREIPPALVPLSEQQEVSDALSGPALAPGEGRMYCGMQERRGVGADGRYRCVPRDP